MSESLNTLFFLLISSPSVEAIPPVKSTGFSSAINSLVSTLFPSVLYV